MKFIDGWWGPDHVGGVGCYVGRAAVLGSYLDERMEGRARAVALQAGGHVGAVPLELAKRFQRVYTWEPELRNFQAMVRNTDGIEGIYPARGCLGDGRGCVAVDVQPTVSGGHQTRAGAVGEVPCYRIDDLGLDACDLICLDTEGYEMIALRGAIETVEKFRPLLVIEENSCMSGYGREPGDLAAWLAPMGYVQVGAVDEDLVFEVPR